MIHDFHVFWEAARVVLEGLSPYTVSGYISTPLLAWCFIPFGLLSWKVACWAWYAANASWLLLWCSRDRRVLNWKTLCFVPLIVLMIVGQVDLLVMLLGLWAAPAALGLLVFLKPQLGLVLILWRWLQWSKEQRWKNLATVVGTASLVWLAIGALHPGWVGEWRAAAPAVETYASGSASVWGLGKWALPAIIVTAPLALLLFRRTGAFFWSAFALINPITNAYSLITLLPYLDWWAVGLSWAAMIMALVLHTGAVFVIVPLYLLWKEAVKAMKVPEAIIPNKNGRIWGGGYGDDKWAEGEVR